MTQRGQSTECGRRLPSVRKVKILNGRRCGFVGIASPRKRCIMRMYNLLDFELRVETRLPNGAPMLETIFFGTNIGTSFAVWAMQFFFLSIHFFPYRVFPNMFFNRKFKQLQWEILRAFSCERVRSIEDKRLYGRGHDIE